MFTGISWNSYLTAVTILLAGYYLFIALRFFRSELLQIFSGKNLTGDKVSFTQQRKPELTSHQAHLQQAFEKQDIFQVAQSLGDEILAYLIQAGKDKVHKEDVMQSLKSLIAKYPSIKDSAFREVIQNLVIKECETNCSIHLSEEDVSVLCR